MRTIIFSNPNLLDKLRTKQVTMTIRSEGYINRNKIQEGVIAKIVYKRGSKKDFIGFAEIIKIKKTTMKQLTSRDAEKCGYVNVETLKTWVKIYNRFKPREEIETMPLYKVEFKWLKVKTIQEYVQESHKI